MKETEKKGLDYFDNQIENGNANVLVMIGTLSEENEELKALCENRKVFIDWVFENYPEVADKYLEQEEIK